MPSVSVILPTLIGCIALSSGGTHADTIFLKDGRAIRDARIVVEQDGFVSLQTPGRQLTIQRISIDRIQKEKSIFDAFDAMRAQAKNNSAAGQWDGSRELARVCCSRPVVYGGSRWVVSQHYSALSL